jgi:hypothetical protein
MVSSAIESSARRPVTRFPGLGDDGTAPLPDRPVSAAKAAPPEAARNQDRQRDPPEGRQQ